MTTRGPGLDDMSWIAGPCLPAAGPPWPAGTTPKRSAGTWLASGVTAAVSKPPVRSTGDIVRRVAVHKRVGERGGHKVEDAPAIRGRKIFGDDGVLDRDRPDRDAQAATNAEAVGAVRAYGASTITIVIKIVSAAGAAGAAHGSVGLDEGAQDRD